MLYGTWYWSLTLINYRDNTTIHWNDMSIKEEILDYSTMSKFARSCYNLFNDTKNGLTSK